jgi:hypothetical protein
MNKNFSLHGKTAEGRPLIHLVEPGSRYGLDESWGLDKTASGEHLPEVLELIESIQPQTDRLYLVNSALGSGEYVGFNLRGDWFTERGLLHTPQGWDRIPVWDIETRRRVANQAEAVPGWGNLIWGYPTFYNAHRFRHHVNKDPERAYGFILGAFWDERMHRVILVSELIREYCIRLGAVDIYDRIARGEFPDTSMGAKVPYDRCSICNNLARTPATYCEHVQKHALPPFGMRAILPDGRMCGVYNDYPRFFDDSFVFIGAERSAKVMDNVTGRINGDRSYTNRVYMPGMAMPKVAGAPSITPSDPQSETQEQEADLGRALAATAQPYRGASSNDIGEQISRVMSLVPVMSEQEQGALNHVATETRLRAAVRDGAISKAEVDLWSSRNLQQLQEKGVGPEQVERARAIVRHHMQHAFGEKLGTAAKWAEHLKEIPVPSEHQKALLRDHTGRLTEVLPQPVLDQCSGDMHRGLSALAHLGVVLRPEEYQYCMLRRMGLGGVAVELRQQSVIFRPVPVDVGHTPHFRPLSARSDEMEDYAGLLGPALAERSFAPHSVRMRLMNPPPMRTGGAPLESRDDETLNKVAQLYNDYRIGLLAHTPDWSYMPSSGGSVTMQNVPKVGQAPELISTYLLHLAYWPTFQIG